MDMFFLKDILFDEINEMHEQHRRKTEEQQRQKTRREAMEMQHDPQCAFRRAQMEATAASSAALSLSCGSASPSQPASLVDFLASLSASPSTHARPEPALPDTPPIAAAQAVAVAGGRQHMTNGRIHNDQLKAPMPIAPVATAAPLPAIPASSFPAWSPARSALDTPFSCATFAQLQFNYSSSLTPVMACFEEEENEGDCGDGGSDGEREEKVEEARPSSAQQPLSPFAVICSPARDHAQRRASSQLTASLTFSSNSATAVFASDMDSKHNTPPPAAVTSKQQPADFEAEATTDAEWTAGELALVSSRCHPKQLDLWELDEAVDLAIAAAAASTAAAAVDSATKTDSTEIVACDATASTAWTADLSTASASPPRSPVTLRSCFIFCCLLLLLSVALLTVLALLDDFAPTLSFGGLIDVTLPSLLVDAMGIDRWPGVQHALFVPRAGMFCS